jgi:hypothetical protein
VSKIKDLLEQGYTSVPEPKKREIEVVGEITFPHSVRILWGSKSHQGDDDPIWEYRFATEAELTAFMLGVNAAEGWLGYQMVED